MQITFAIPRTIDGTDYAPDQTAEIPDDVAGQLIRDGFARAGADTKDAKAAKRAAAKAAADLATQQHAELPQPPPRTGKGSGTDQWVDYASAHGVAVSEGSGREEIIDLLDVAGVPTGAPADPDSPDEGETQEKE